MGIVLEMKSDGLHWFRSKLSYLIFLCIFCYCLLVRWDSLTPSVLEIVTAFYVVSFFAQDLHQVWDVGMQQLQAGGQDSPAGALCACKGRGLVVMLMAVPYLFMYMSLYMSLCV